MLRMLGDRVSCGKVDCCNDRHGITVSFDGRGICFAIGSGGCTHVGEGDLWVTHAIDGE